MEIEAAKIKDGSSEKNTKIHGSNEEKRHDLASQRIA